MPKLKLTKGELKRQRDSLRRFEHYLPILQLKKQQLQLEIRRVNEELDLKMQEIDTLEDEIGEWAGLLNEPGDYVSQWIRPKEIRIGSFNIAGVDLPVLENVGFEEEEYDLYATPLWVDIAIREIRKFVTLLEQEKVIRRQLEILEDELETTSQRVNLFEKVKIPEARENARVIRIFLGDQQKNAVGRSKIAKKKIESFVLQGV